MEPALTGLRALPALALAALAFQPAVAVAQEALPLELEEVDLEGYPSVSLTLAVPPELAGAQLRAEQILVQEEEEFRTVTVERMPGDDLDVVLVIDTSGSMKGAPMEAAKAAAVGFLQQIPAEARVAVIGFGGTPGLASPFSSDRSFLIVAVQGLEAQGETALYDALVTGVDELGGGSAKRKALIVLSDGGDTVSKSSLQDALGRVTAADVDFHAVELQSPEYDSAPLRTLAEATGGRVASAADPASLESIYRSIAARLTNRYRVTYASSAHGPTQVRVAVSDGLATAEVAQVVRFPAAPAPPPEAPAEAAVPALRPGVLVVPGLLAQPRALVVALSVLFVAVLIVILAVALPAGQVIKLSRRYGGRRGDVRASAMAGLANRATVFAERTLDRRGRRLTLTKALERAGVMLRPGEFLVLIGCAVITAFALGYVVGGPLLGSLLGVVALLGSRLGLSFLADRRRGAFSEQLGETLVLLAGTLRAGYGLLQAADTVAKEAPSPTSDEFRRLVLETRLGRELGAALRAMDERVGSQDFAWVVQAIEIHQEVGGDLSEVLETVAATIRDRNKLRRQVKALSAEGRISAIILLILPFAMAALISITNPTYLTELFTTTPGRVMVGTGLILMVVGTIWMRKVVKVEF